MAEDILQPVFKISLEVEISEIFGYNPRPDQLFVVEKLVVDMEDLILVARTGFGKSMVFQSVPLLRRGIGMHDRIVAGEFTHLLAGPEVLLSKEFARILEEKRFQDRLVLVAIDELHIVEQWGSRFRPIYDQLRSLRVRISRSVPWFETSATLPADTLPLILASVGFNQDVYIHRTSVDRPDIWLDVRQMKHSETGGEDLLFLLEPFRKAIERAPTGLQDPSASQTSETSSSSSWVTGRRSFQMQQSNCNNSQTLDKASKLLCFSIPKTIVYVKTIAAIVMVEGMLIRALRWYGCTLPVAKAVIKPYHSQLAESDKRAISCQFSMPDCKNPFGSSAHRIVVATDAMGMGINNPDVRQVVQFGKPDGLSSLWQRASRAARKDGVKRDFIWFVEPWCFGPRITPIVLTGLRPVDSS
ncbi:MAG: hypothetical protein M1829_003284 [Trizodia sp. TS-e1964]|nr:MAG: hypothetical protein M1829_003284 [Trizodia sp. TS-e1964]